MLLATALVLQVAATQLSTADIDCSFKDRYPRHYVAYKVQGKDLVMDGSLDDPAWQEVPWTDSFVDIATQTKPHYDTKVKMRYDDKWLYIGAMLQEDNIWATIMETCHCVNDKQDQVIYHDNDFEIFVDPTGSNHNYKEVEVNAANATWVLLLDKPYENGGSENSTRVSKDGWDMQPPLHCKTKVDGKLNDPSSHHRYWSVEMAMPLDKLAFKHNTAVPPKPKSWWRINFSRVEWGVKVVNNKYVKTPSCQSCATPGADMEDNWVWAPQGQIAMHMPERWGVVEFSDRAVNSTTPTHLPDWTARSVAMELYEAQRAYFADRRAFTADINALKKYAKTTGIFDGVCTAVPKITVASDTLSYNAEVTDTSAHKKASIRSDRLLQVVDV